jgi:hypothetical protein
MFNQITITSISGAAPYDIYVCDQTITYCYFVQTFTGGTITITVPPPLDQANPIVLKITDANGCELIQPLTCQEIYGKEFENFPIFLFQDAAVFLFQGPV